MTRDVLYVNGVPMPAGPRYVPPRLTAPAPRPDCHPPCCGAQDAGNGGHEPHCMWRPTPARIFDHLSGGPDDARFSRVAHAMRSEPWWRGIPIIVWPHDVSGEIDA